MSNLPYKIGDRILQHCFGEPKTARRVRVTDKHKNVKNGRSGFDGVADGGMEVWGYDEEVMEVISHMKKEEA